MPGEILLSIDTQHMCKPPSVPNGDMCQIRKCNARKKNDGSEFLNRVQKKLNESSLSADAPEAGSAAATDPNSSRTRINSH